MTDKKLIIVARILVKSEELEKVKPEILKLIPITKTEKGCIKYDLHQDNTTPNLFLFYEEWENRDLWQDHINNTHIKEFSKLTEGLIEEVVVHEMTYIA